MKLPQNIICHKIMVKVSNACFVKNWVIRSNLRFHSVLGGHTVSGLPRSGKISGRWNFFQVREKSENFLDGQGNLERSHLKSEGKVREFENKWLWQAAFIKFIYSVQEGKGLYFLRDSQGPSPFPSGATLKRKNLLPWGANFSFKSTPNFEVIQFAPLK